jgi:hypothetical protein
MRVRSVFVATAAVALGLFGLAGAAAAQEGEDATVTVVHDIEDLDPVAIAVDGTIAVESLAFGESAGPLPLEAGTYFVEVFDADGTDGDALLEAELVLDAGVNYTVTATVVDGTPQLVVEDDSEEAETGTLVVQHDVQGGPTVYLGVTPFVGTDDEADEIDLGALSFGEELEVPDLPVGTHLLTIYADAALTQPLGDAEFDIAAGETTTVTASSVLGAPSPAPSPTATGIRTPDRVNTGAGGTEGNGGTAALVLAGLAAAAVGVGVTARRRAA